MVETRDPAGVGKGPRRVNADLRSSALVPGGPKLMVDDCGRNAASSPLSPGSEVSVREESDNDEDQSEDGDTEASPTKSPTTPKSVKSKNPSGTVEHSGATDGFRGTSGPGGEGTAGHAGHSERASSPRDTRPECLPPCRSPRGHCRAGTRAAPPRLHGHPDAGGQEGPAPVRSQGTQVQVSAEPRAESCCGRAASCSEVVPSYRTREQSPRRCDRPRLSLKDPRCQGPPIPMRHGP